MDMQFRWWTPQHGYSAVADARAGGLLLRYAGSLLALGSRRSRARERTCDT